MWNMYHFEEAWKGSRIKITTTFGELLISSDRMKS
jgi:hypothetical protein